MIKQTTNTLPIPAQKLHAIRRIFAAAVRHKKRTALGGITLLSVCIGLFLAWPRTIAFSYAQLSCVSSWVAVPGIFGATDTRAFQLEPQGGLRIGAVWLGADKICAVPKSTPLPGQYTLSFSPFGMSWLGTPVAVNVPEMPQLSAHPLGAPVAVSRPLSIPLSTADEVFSYRMKIGEATVACPVKAQALLCDISQKSLKQGTVYPVEVTRYFESQKVETVLAREVTTLTAASVRETSIKPRTTVYDKPRSVELLLDKPVEDAVVELTGLNEGRTQDIKTSHMTDGQKLTVTWNEDLPRRQSFELRLKTIRARDGSALAEPFVLPFETSGGPKVTNISVGTSKVPVGATALLTFDQPLQEGQDISKAVQVSSGTTVERRGNQVAVNLAGVPRCGTFTITVGDNLVSTHGISGGSAWKHTGRMLCHTTGVIGTSAKGRPIIAYYFGDGPVAALYTGAIHGSEPSTRLLMLRWIDELEANPGGIPAGKSVVVVPAINPDGVAAGQRTNANNVDLNRNFGTSDWKKDITTVNNTPFPGGGGPNSMSEPETRAIAGLVARHRPGIVLSYHSIGGVVISNQTGGANSRAATYVSLSRYGNATGNGDTFDYSISGTADDYYGQILGVPSLVIELGSHTYHQFERNRQAMWAMLR